MPTNRTLTPDQASDLVRKYWEQYRVMVVERLRPRWREYYQKYRSYLEQRRRGNRESTLFIPRSFDSVETIVPRILLAIYSVNPPFQMAPRGASDVDFADTLTEVYQYFGEVTNQYGTVAQALRNVCIYGTGIIKSGWNAQLKRPERYNVDIHEFFIDPAALEIEDAEFCGDKKVRSLSYLKNMESRGLYTGVDAVKKDGQRFSTPSDLTTDNMMVTGLINPNDIKQKMDDDPLYEVIECWIDGGATVLTIAGGKLIRSEANPFPHQTFPYSPIKMIPDTTEFHGIGAIEPIRFLQDQLNDFNNASMDYVMRSINQIMKVGISEWENSSSWQFKQGAKWKVNQMDGVQPLDMKPLPAEAFSVTTQLNAYIDRALSLSDYSRGFQGGSVESATGASLLAQAADNRLKLQLYYCQQYLKRMVNMEAQCIQEWVPDQFVIRITEHPYTKPIDRAAIQGEFDVFAAGISDLATKETKRSQLTNLLQTILTTGAPQLLALQGKKLDMGLLFKQIFDTYEIKNSDALMKDIPAPPPGVPGAPAGMPGQQAPVAQNVGGPGNLTDLLQQQATEKSPLQTPQTSSNRYDLRRELHADEQVSNNGE